MDSLRCTDFGLLRWESSWRETCNAAFHNFFFPDPSISVNQRFRTWRQVHIANMKSNKACYSEEIFNIRSCWGIIPYSFTYSALTSSSTIRVLELMQVQSSSINSRTRWYSVLAWLRCISFFFKFIESVVVLWYPHKCIPFPLFVWAK